MEENSQAWRDREETLADAEQMIWSRATTPRN